MSLREKLVQNARRQMDRGIHAFAKVSYATLPSARPSRHGVQLVRDVPYKMSRDPAHRLDVYRPERAHALRPAVLYVHGGGFSILSKDTHRVMALGFATRGYVVFNTNYRLAPRHAYPAPLEDVCAALRWVQKHAAEHGADPNRIILAGESAGGNLVTALALCVSERREEPFARAVYDAAPAVRAVCAIYGMHDVHDVPRRWRERPHTPGWVRMMTTRAARSYLGPASQESPETAPLASPLRILERPATAGSRPLPPFFASVGTRDPLLDDSRRLQKALEARGGICELTIHPGEIHGFDAIVWRDAARAKWRAQAAFLKRHVGPLEPRDETHAP